ncbi:hypothetical protein [Chryseobacterium herbae]|uniref:Uncharacterized protein n=1 Tax=Chryseobacterium herbae TaxID=2976476 RepID=A0ABT2IQR8_9FLAO|nr:hypothetical protein [Chryseobacterium sp. pc1-10]MCT2560725.1 hypothetical protein [Chryseobacterium sp. pc1-10]
MADLEIRKHAKQALRVLTDKEKKSVWHKIREFLLEIFIIVFAVSLSIWLHGISEKRHQAEEVREFLSDLKVDLANDRQEILNLKKAFPATNPEKIKTDTIRIKDSPAKGTPVEIQLQRIIRSSNLGNYEGFKSSGNIAYISNKPLKRKILKYYEQDIKLLEGLEKTYNNQVERIADEFLDAKSQHLRTNNFLLETYRQSVNEKYDQTILEINIIIKEIDTEIK